MKRVVVLNSCVDMSDLAKIEYAQRKYGDGNYEIFKSGQYTNIFVKDENGNDCIVSINRWDKDSEGYIERHDKILLSIVDEYKDKAFENILNRNQTHYDIIEIPDDVEYFIQEPYMGGMECVVEKHRVWYSDKE